MCHRLARGQSLTEFALLTPVVFLALFGLFDLGGAVYTYGTLEHGTQVAAAYASIHCGYSGSGYTDAQLTQQVLQAGTLLQPPQLGVIARPTNDRCNQAGTTITVTSTYLYRPLTPVLQGFFPSGGLNLKATVVVLAQ